MADFNPKKLQVFVSSTYTDLKKERQAAVEAILTAGHIPAGMELFTAGDESQMDVIKQWINESDVFLLILGGRYGSIEPTTGKSYIQLEYEYAASKSKPVFACVVKDTAIDDRSKEAGRSVLEMEHPLKLREFRATVLTKMSQFWEDTKDIKIAVAESLSHLARRENLVGWVRPDTQSNLPALADEIARLSKENAQMRKRVAELEELARHERLVRPEIPSLEYFSQLAERYPRNAIQEAWAYMESSVNYAISTHDLHPPAYSVYVVPDGIQDKLSRLVAHGNLKLAEGERIMGEFYSHWSSARGDSEFKLSPNEILETIRGLLSFSSALVQECDGVWAIRLNAAKLQESQRPAVERH